MKNLLSLLTVAGIAAAFAAPAHADEFVARYTYLVNGAVAPVATTLTQPAIIDSACGTRVLSRPALVEPAYGTRILSQPALVEPACGTRILSQPALVEPACSTSVISQPAIVGRPIMVEDHENIVPHFFHIGLWPLVDFSLF